MVSAGPGGCPNCSDPDQSGRFCTACGSALDAAGPTVRSSRRDRMMWLVAGLVVLLVAAGTGVVVAMSGSADTEVAESTTESTRSSALPSSDGVVPPASSPTSVTATTSAVTAAVSAVVTPSPTVIVLDASGSMKNDDAPGPRIDAATTAVRTLVDGLPDGSPVGLIVYGTSTDGSDAAKAAGCQDIKTLVPVAPVDKAAFSVAVDGVVASGYTPLGNSLRAAAAALPGSGPRNIILVSDGEDTCAPPEPCDVAREIGGGDLVIHTVGFRVTGTAKDQLTCVAAAGGGKYVDAANATQLQAFLRTAVDANAMVDTLTHTGFDGLTIGMSVDQAKSVDSSINAASSGTVVIVWRDCDLIFIDGMLVSIERHKNSSTQDGLAVGDDIAKAGQLYGSSAVQTAGGRTHAVFAAEPDSDIGYDVTFTPKEPGQLAGPITRIVLCRCRAAVAMSVAVVNPNDYMNTSGRWWFRTPDDGWNCSITITSGRVFCESGRYSQDKSATYPPATSADVEAAGCEEIGFVAGRMTLTATGASYGGCGHGDASEFYYNRNDGNPGLGRILADGQVLEAGGFRCFVTGFAVTCSPYHVDGVGFTIDETYYRTYPRDGAAPSPQGASAPTSPTPTETGNSDGGCPTSDQLIQSFTVTDPSLVPDSNAVSFTNVRCVDGATPLARWLAAEAQFADGSSKPVLFGWDHDEQYWFEKSLDANTCRSLPAKIADVCSGTR